MKFPGISRRRWLDPNVHVSEHFLWDEVVARSGYRRPLPTAITLPAVEGVRPRRTVDPRKGAKRHAKNLERLRTAINQARARHHLPPTGIRINSWARSVHHNDQVDGAVDSRHLYFDATDITREEVRRLCPWAGGMADFDVIASAVFNRGGFGTYPGGARHVDSRGRLARWNDWARRKRAP